MEPMEEEFNEDEDIDYTDSGADKSPADVHFDEVIGLLQEIFIDPKFTKNLSDFMQTNWGILDETSNLQAEKALFEHYQRDITLYIHLHISPRLPQFRLEAFLELLHERKQMVDDQILDTLYSLVDIEHFKLFIKDYRHSYEQEEMLKVLTIKSNKIPENKKVKGKDNIFASELPTFDQPLKMPKPKQVTPVEPSEADLLVPDLLFTIKPMKKC